MKNDLTCGVVRDLLPSYVEGLTSQETNTAVERHLADCPDCTRLRADLAGETPPPPEEVKEVDYLKKVKRRGWRRVAAAVAVTVLVLALGIAAKLFVIGTPIQAKGMGWTINTDVPGELDLRVYSIWSGTACRRWKAEQEPGGIVRITCRQVLPSPFGNSGDYQTVLGTEGVNAVFLGEQLIWQDGVVISPQMDRVYQVKTPYIGDASAVGQVVQALQFSDFGKYTMELHTSAQPYRLTLRFSIPQSPEVFHPQDIYPAMAAALAVIGNLDEMECAFQGEDGQPWSYVLTVEELNQALPQIVSVYNERLLYKKDCSLYGSVKDYANSCSSLQQLYEAMRWAIELGAYTPQVQS